MKTYAELEAEHLAFCKQVRSDAMKIVGAAGNGKSEKAAALGLELAQKARTQACQYTMQQEQAGSYDLSALKVDATAASNSETGWERDA